MGWVKLPYGTVYSTGQGKSSAKVEEIKKKQGSGAEDSVGPHSGRPVLLWSTMKIWIVYFHF